MAICSHIVSIFGKMTRSGYVMYTAVRIMVLSMRIILFLSIFILSSFVYATTGFESATVGLFDGLSLLFLNGVFVVVVCSFLLKKIEYFRKGVLKYFVAFFNAIGILLLVPWVLFSTIAIVGILTNNSVYGVSDLPLFLGSIAVCVVLIVFNVVMSPVK